MVKVNGSAVALWLVEMEEAWRCEAARFWVSERSRERG